MSRHYHSVISAEDIAKRCVHMDEASQLLYQSMLRWAVARDRALGIRSHYVEDPERGIVYCRDASTQASPMTFSLRSIESEQWGTIGLNYSMALRRLVVISDSDTASQKAFLDALTLLENQYLKLNERLSPEQSPDLLRQSFIRDDLAHLMLTHQLTVAGTPVTDIEVALTLLDKAKDWTRLAMMPMVIETTNTLCVNGEDIARYRRTATPLHRLSDDFRTTFSACRREASEQPGWFKLLSPLDQQLLLSYLDAILANGLIPSQLRQLPGMKNAFLHDIAVQREGEDTFTSQLTHVCAATCVPMIKGIDETEQQRLTAMAIENMRSLVGATQFTIGTLVSKTGDRTLSIVDEMRRRIPGKYWDAVANGITKQTAADLPATFFFQLCMNIFRYGESDDVQDIEGHIHGVMQAVSSFAKPPETLATLIESMDHHALAALTTMTHMSERVSRADAALKKNLMLPQLIRSLVEGKLKHLRTDVKATLTKEELLRFAATKIKRKKNKRSLWAIDGDLKAITLIFLYTRLLNELSQLKAKQGLLCDVADQARLEALPDTVVGFGCMSGNNRTEHAAFLMAAFALLESVTNDGTNPRDKQRLEEAIIVHLSDDFMAQVMTGAGGTPGFIGLRPKSKDSTSTYYINVAPAAAQLHLPFSDAKSMDRTLAPMSGWIYHCRHTCQGAASSQAFLAALDQIETQCLRQYGMVPLDARTALDRESLQKQRDAMLEDCQARGIFPHLLPHHHPDWFLFQQRVTLLRQRTSAELKATRLWHVDLPPIPAVTPEIMQRDEAIQVINATLHYLSLSMPTDSRKRPLLQAAKQHVFNLLAHYRISRFTRPSDLKSALWHQIMATLEVWQQMEGSKKAYTALLPICQALGYDAPRAAAPTSNMTIASDTQSLVTWLKSGATRAPRKVSAPAILVRTYAARSPSPLCETPEVAAPPRVISMRSDQDALLLLAKHMKQRIEAQCDGSNPNYRKVIACIEAFLKTPIKATANLVYYGLLSTGLRVANLRVLMEQFSRQSDVFFGAADTLALARSKYARQLEKQNRQLEEARSAHPHNLERKEQTVDPTPVPTGTKRQRPAHPQTLEQKEQTTDPTPAPEPAVTHTKRQRSPLIVWTAWGGLGLGLASFVSAGGAFTAIDLARSSAALAASQHALIALLVVTCCALLVGTASTVIACRNKQPLYRCPLFNRNRVAQLPKSAP